MNFEYINGKPFITGLAYGIDSFKEEIRTYATVRAAYFQPVEDPATGASAAVDYGDERFYLKFDANAFDHISLGTQANGLYGALYSLFETAVKYEVKLTVQFLYHDAGAGYMEAVNRCAFVAAVDDEKDPLYQNKIAFEIGAVTPNAETASRRFYGYAKALVGTYTMYQELKAYADAHSKYLIVEIRSTESMAHSDGIVFEYPAYGDSAAAGFAIRASYPISRCNCFTPIQAFEHGSEGYSEVADQFYIRYIFGAPAGATYTVDYLVDKFMKYYSTAFRIRFGSSMGGVRTTSSSDYPNNCESSQNEGEAA